MLTALFSLTLLATEPPDTAIEMAAPLPESVLKDQAIKEAVRQVLDEDRATTAPLGLGAQADFRGSGPYAKFAKDLAYAKIPSCIGAGRTNPLKFQEARIGPIAFVGIFALPFIAVAAVRGKCN